MTSRGIGWGTAVGLLLALSLAAPATAAPGGDAIVEVSEFTIPDAPSALQTASATCPAGTRAVGGGVAPSSPLLSGTVYEYAVRLSQPVDETGVPANTQTGDIARGWSATIGNNGSLGSAEAFRVFAVCSASSDATVQVNPLGGGLADGTAECPVGTRAVGGGIGTLEPIPPNTDPFRMVESSPVDETLTTASTQAGDTARGWHTRLTTAGVYVTRFFALCSASSDAVVQVASFSVAASNDTGTTAAADCPTGKRALSGGLAPVVVNTDENRFQFGAPAASVAQIASVADGAVATSWLGGAGSTDGLTVQNWRTFALCAANDVPVNPPPGGGGDTTVPDTAKGNGPKKKSTKRKATFEFSSEPGATFECQLDKKPASACTSPAKANKLKPGKHKFTVTAIDAAGNRDPSPLVFKFKVTKP